ncbi:MAG: TPM domain-containing protein, partial [bacterium]
MRIHAALLFALALPQRTPVGGAITKYVPPVPTPTSFISDARGVLTSDAHAALDAHIGTVQRAGRGDIAVAILPSIGDYSPNQVAVEIYRTWRVGSVAAIGSAQRDVGVLIL